jgi:hypothetical protein
MSAPPVRLRVPARSTLHEFDGAERVIVVVEDALATSRLARAERGDLLAADASRRALPGKRAPGPRLTHDAVQALFRRHVSRSPR